MMQDEIDAAAFEGEDVLLIGFQRQTDTQEKSDQPCERRERYFKSWKKVIILVLKYLSTFDRSNFNLSFFKG